MLVMGILNVTPDSFADGGQHYEASLAIAHGLEMIEDGVDIIDVGGESTRPGADRVTEEEEQARVIPVIRELATKGIEISVDTMRATTPHAPASTGKGGHSTMGAGEGAPSAQTHLRGPPCAAP